MRHEDACCCECELTTELPPYQERFIREYHELKNRTDKLNKMLARWEGFYRKKETYTYYDSDAQDKRFAEWMGFTPSCSKDLLDEQLSVMKQYLHILEVRAEIEGINLSFQPARLGQ